MTEHISTSQCHDYIDHTCDAAERARIDAHLATCAVCRAELSAWSALVSETRALAREIQPVRDLRTGIAERVAALPAPTRVTQRRQRLLPLLAAAAVLVIITASVTRWWLVRDGRPVASSTTAPPATILPASFREEERRYVSEIEGVQRTLAAERDRLSPVTVDILRRNMAIIDRAIAESRSALAHDPANRDLGRMVLSAYEQKLELLQRTRSVAL